MRILCALAGCFVLVLLVCLLLSVAVIRMMSATIGDLRESVGPTRPEGKP